VNLVLRAFLDSSHKNRRLKARFRLALALKELTMAKKANRALEALLPKIPLLATESRREFNRTRDALDQQIKPDDVPASLFRYPRAKIAKHLEMALPIRLAFLCVLPLVLGTGAFAQSIVTDCDKYAADGLDPQRKAAGVDFENMNVALAFPACEDAVLQYRNSARLAYQLGRTYEKANKLTIAAKQYGRAADQNYAAAQLALGMLYANGQGVPKDDQQYIFWARKAADQGYAVAQDALGYVYLNGRGVPEDDQQAVAWFRKAADQGYAAAQNRLGFMYLTGVGAPKDDEQAVAWFRKAADQEDPAAQDRLGFIYQAGEGVPKDDEQAAAWFRKAADHGYAAAQDRLGLMYKTGEGVPKDDQQAVAWFRKAADQGYAFAQNSLGAMYANGQGVPKDDEQAVAWYRKAAEHGLADALYMLGLAYANGRGVPQDKAQALAWLRKAAEKDHAEAKKKLHELETSQDANGKR
jgi:TPR repeat protein